MNARNIFAAIAVVLALLLAYTFYWGNGLQGEKTALIQKNERLNTEMDDLNNLKITLETEVDSLEVAYEALAVKNEDLQGSLSDTQRSLRKKNAAIKKIQASNKSAEDEMGGLRAQIQTLLNTKSLLESNITAIQAQNDSLRARTGVLEANLETAAEENTALANLNQTIQDEVKSLTLANFKASAFRVEVEKKKSSKVTTKSKRARKINVSFDLTGVPAKFQGVRPVYLVITNDKATPVQMETPIKAQVSVNGQPTDILAAEAKEINITDNQRLTFAHELATKLKAGYYRVAVYTDIGMLGATSFRLR